MCSSLHVTGVRHSMLTAVGWYICLPARLQLLCITVEAGQAQGCRDVLCPEQKIQFMLRALAITWYARCVRNSLAWRSCPRCAEYEMLRTA